MGSVFLTMSHRGTEQAMRKAFDEQVAQDGYDFGHSYSGSFSEFYGLSVTSRVFETCDQASEWLEENTSKFQEAKAVRFKDIKLTDAMKTRMLKLSDKACKLNEVKFDTRRACKAAKNRAANRTKVPAYVVAAEAAVVKADKAALAAWQAVRDIDIKAAAKTTKTIWLMGGWASD